MHPFTSCTLLSFFILLLHSLPTVLATNPGAILSTPYVTIGVHLYLVNNQSSTYSIFIDTFSFAGPTTNTTNLPLPLTGNSSIGSSTLLVLRNPTVEPLVPLCILPDCSLSSSASSITVTNLSFISSHSGTVAKESWTFTLLNDTAFQWSVNRTYASDSSILSSDLSVNRLGFTFQTTGGLPIYAQQIPSYVDLNMFYDNTTTGGFDIHNSAYEYLSPTSFQYVRFSPTGSLFTYYGEYRKNSIDSDIFWSFAKPFADGTTWCNIGYESIDPRVPNPSNDPLSTEEFSVTVNFLAADVPAPSNVYDPFPSIDISFTNKTLENQVRTLLGTQYQLNGWIMGNNPASVPCLHEMAWWPLIASIYPADSVVFTAMQKELSFFATCGYAPSPWTGDYNTSHSCEVADGAMYGLTQRYASSGFYSCPWGALQDQNVMFPIAVYYVAMSTGDWAWLSSMQPALDAIFTYLQMNGLNTSAVTNVKGRSPSYTVFTAPTTGIADGGRHTSNWYDVINFGHYDAYLAVHGVWALKCLGEMYTVLNDTANAVLAETIYAQAKVDFNTLFWNDTAKAYTDWIDIDGNARHYFYVDIPFTAILANVTLNFNQSQALMDHYNNRLSVIYTEYNVSEGNIWSPPCSLYPITNAKEFATNEPLVFPTYESGGSFFHSPGLQYAALGSINQSSTAYNFFVTLMNSPFGAIRGWAQQLYWGNPGSLVGFDPLNTALLSVWGFMFSVFGVRPSLTGGITFSGNPAIEMEGSRWNMSYLGKNVCFTVQNGQTVFCNDERK